MKFNPFRVVGIVIVSAVRVSPQGTKKVETQPQGG
jgi:hypothetical protein